MGGWLRDSLARSCCGTVGGRFGHQVRQADQVVGGGDEVTRQTGPVDAPVPGVPESSDGLHPTKDLLNPLADPALPVNQTGFLSRFTSANLAGPNNRWSPSNRHGYVNPAADEILYRVDRTLRREERMALWAEVNRILVDEVAYMPLYNFPYPYFVRKEVAGAMPGNPINPPTYFVHTWDLR
jgi:ABC-type transport system substrate-binding protein